jgi:hypothetical protein
MEKKEEEQEVKQIPIKDSPTQGTEPDLCIPIPRIRIEYYNIFFARYDRHIYFQLTDLHYQRATKRKKEIKTKKRKISEIDPADEQPKKKQNTNSGVNKSYLDVFGPNAKPDLTLKLEAVKKNDIKIRVRAK